MGNWNYLIANFYLFFISVIFVLIYEVMLRQTWLYCLVLEPSDKNKVYILPATSHKHKHIIFCIFCRVTIKSWKMAKHPIKYILCFKVLKPSMCTFFHLALRVHISSQTRDILMTLGGFNIERRGEIEMKVCWYFLFNKFKCSRQCSKTKF